MVQIWVLIIGLAVGNGDTIATIPGFPDSQQCMATGQAWLDKIETLPNEQDQWDGKRPPKFMCFQIAAPTPYVEP